MGESRFVEILGKYLVWEMGFGLKIWEGISFGQKQIGGNHNFIEN